MALVVTRIVVAVVQARRVHAFAATLTATAAGMNLDGNALADGILVDIGPELDDRAHELVAGREVLVERQVALDQGRRPTGDDLEIRRADRNGIDSNQHFGSAGAGHGFVDERQLAWVAEHPRLHRRGNRDRVNFRIGTHRTSRPSRAISTTTRSSARACLASRESPP